MHVAIACVCIHLQEEPTVIPGTAILREAVKPRNYLVLSLINLLLCCCLPLGIIGLICSLRVRYYALHLAT